MRSIARRHHRAGLEAYRAGPDRTAPTLSLHHLLERQHYKLGHWRLASSDINYRRFFDINTLAGLRVEDAGTFEAIHPDGQTADCGGKLHGCGSTTSTACAIPFRYFQRLRRLVREAHGGQPALLRGGRENSRRTRKAARHCGVHGTTGYEWMNTITHVLTDGRGLEPLDEIWRQVSNQSPKLEPILRDAKRRVLETLLTSEFTVLTRLLARIASGHYSTRDYSADSLRQALELYVLHFRCIAPT
jgi:(1->4)-alpha-D-glucan 1-alpha-D-glucosylmutase